MVVVELPIKTVAGLNAREHFLARSRRVRGERAAAHMSVKYKHGRPDLPVVVTMVRLSAGSLDDDNLQGAFKAIRDGVADAYGVPDNDPRIQWRYAQERCKRGYFAVRIEVESA
jgi:hypothetical protein